MTHEEAVSAQHDWVWAGEPSDVSPGSLRDIAATAYLGLDRDIAGNAIDELIEWLERRE